MSHYSRAQQISRLGDIPSSCNTVMLFLCIIAGRPTMVRAVLDVDGVYGVCRLSSCSSHIRVGVFAAHSRTSYRAPRPSTHALHRSRNGVPDQTQSAVWLQNSGLSVRAQMCLSIVNVVARADTVTAGTIWPAELCMLVMTTKRGVEQVQNFKQSRR
jgi:hypothetical protein